MSLPQEKNKHYPEITDVEVGEDTICAKLSDGRTISIPIAWFDRLEKATKKQLRVFYISPP